MGQGILEGNVTEAYNIDCMEYMKTVPDKYFDLAVVDPPYGGGSRERERENCAAAEQTGSISKGQGSEGGLISTISVARTGGTWASKYQGGFFSQDIKVGRTGGTWASKYDTTIQHWDIAPTEEYFNELARVSKNQIIWGGNYFDLPPTRCFLIWRKLSISENFTMAMVEYAWTSFNDNAKCFEHTPQGTKEDERFHPTQKPVALYEWIYKRYAKPGNKILDTHMGSGSSRIAAYHMGFDYVGCEIDKVYFDLQEKRFERVQNDNALFGEAE